MGGRSCSGPSLLASCQPVATRHAGRSRAGGAASSASGPRQCAARRPIGSDLRVSPSRSGTRPSADPPAAATVTRDLTRPASRSRLVPSGANRRGENARPTVRLPRNTAPARALLAPARPEPPMTTEVTLTPLAAIEAEALPRDRTAVEPEALAELQASILALRPPPADRGLRRRARARPPRPPLRPHLRLPPARRLPRPRPRHGRPLRPHPRLRPPPRRRRRGALRHDRRERDPRRSLPLGEGPHRRRGPRPGPLPHPRRGRLPPLPRHQPPAPHPHPRRGRRGRGAARRPPGTARGAHPSPAPPPRHRHPRRKRAGRPIAFRPSADALAA